MIYDSIIVTGSAQVSGSLSVTGGITGSFQGTATTASYVLNAVSASFATSASYILNAVSSSFATSSSVATTAATASYLTPTNNYQMNLLGVGVAPTAPFKGNFYGQVIIQNGINNATGQQSLIFSYPGITNSLTHSIFSGHDASVASYNKLDFYIARTSGLSALNVLSLRSSQPVLIGAGTGLGLDVSGSTTITGSLATTGNITSAGTLTAQTLVVQTITSSVLYSSGSNVFGNALSNTQVMTGSVGITGSLTLNNIAIPTSASLASTYLQLAGGTLTGALGGTSATFSSNNFDLTGASTALTIARTTGSGFVGNATAGAYVNFYGATHATKANKLEIVAASGVDIQNALTGTSATFSSSVTSNVNDGSAGFNSQPTTTTNSAFNQFLNADGYAYIGKNSSAGGNLAAGSSAYAFVMSTYKSGGTSAPIQFAPNNSIAMTITSGGNVVIGNTTVTNSAGYTKILNVYDPSSAAAIGISIPSHDYQFGAESDGALRIRYNNSVRLTIASTGAATFSSTNASLNVVAILSPPTGGYVNLQCQSNSSGNTSYGGLNVISSTGKAGYLTCGDNSFAAGNYFAQASFVTLAATTGAGIKLRVNADDTLGITIPTSGNVGIGTTSPQAILSIKGATNNTVIEFENGGATKAFMRAYDRSAGAYREYEMLANELLFSTGASPSERMRITSGGQVYVANTSGLNGMLNSTTTDGNFALTLFDGFGNNALAGFRNSSASQVGSITIVGGGSVTSYNTTSDYRLKEDFKQIKGLEKVLKIKVYDFKWKSGDYRMDGVIAHELAEVIPYAVVGEKDAKEMQSVDYSKLTPILIKAIQELSSKNDALQSQINELKNK